MSKYKCCGFCILAIAILIPLCLNNITLFLFVTDVIWNILNLIDNSRHEYNGYISVHDNAFMAVHEEVIDYNLKVIGQIPSECDGVMFKVSPNPQFSDNVAGKYHWFDGDGMVFATKFISKNNTAHYSNSFMRTTKYLIENKYNRSIYFNLIGATHANGIIGLIKMIFGLFIYDGKFSPVALHKYNNGNEYYRGEANTAMLYWNNKLLALNEASAPFQFDYNYETSEITSIGYYNFDNTWNYSFTAHPKVDHNTNQLFTHGAYLGDDMDRMVVGMTSKDNKNQLINSREIKFETGQMMHDMMITDKYILVLDLSLAIGEMVFKESNFTRLMAFMPQHKQSRIGVIVRDQLLAQKNRANIRWFSIKPCFVFHLVNAWNINDEITIIGNRFDKFDLNMFQVSNNTDIGVESVYHHKLYKWLINMRTGEVNERELSVNNDEALIFPQIHPLKRGIKNKYVWFASSALTSYGKLIFNGIVKYDLDKEEIINKINFKNNDEGNSEFALIQKNTKNEEEDVYLSCYIYDNKTEKSRVEIYDGTTMNDKSVATIKLKRRIPLGFHALFVSKQNLS